MLGNIYKTFDKGKCFSKSKLWDIIRDNYRSMGMMSWNQQVPYTVTNSTVTANYHAELIMQNTTGSVGIVDFGAGIGQHGFLLAKALKKLCKKYHRDISDFTIYLADISQECLFAWENSEQMRPMIDSGFIKPVLLTGDWLLDIKTVTAHPHSAHIVIANYLLDSMPFQAFHFNQLQGISISCPRKFLTPDFNGPLSSLTLSTCPIGLSDHALMKHYQHLERYTIPTCAISFITLFFNQCPNGIFVINDKAHLTADHFDLDSQYNLNLEGNFSSTVNIDAITKSINQHCHYIANNAPNLKTVAYSQNELITPKDLCASDLPLMLEHFKQTENMSQELAQILCKTLQYDPFCLEIISQNISPGSSSDKLVDDLKQCLDNHLDNRHSFIQLHLAKIYYKTQLFQQSLEQLDTYQERYGEDGAYLFEKAQYYLHTQKPDLALRYAERSAHDPKIAESAHKLIQIIQEAVILKEN